LFQNKDLHRVSLAVLVAVFAPSKHFSHNFRIALFMEVGQAKRDVASPCSVTGDSEKTLLDGERQAGMFGPLW
jgi:hypothetical protein